MSLDAWGVKLKPGIDASDANWDTIEDVDESDILPRDNYFHDRSYSDVHHSFIEHVLSVQGASFCFSGNPCCSIETMYKVCNSLDSFLKEFDKSTYSWVEEATLENRTLSKKEIGDLYVYVKSLYENGFVMWFSI